MFIQFGTPTKENLLAYAKGRENTKNRLKRYCKYIGYDLFKKEEIKIDYDIKNFINTLDHIEYTKKRFSRILQKYKHAEDKIEFIKSYKEGNSRELALKAINLYRKYKKQKEIHLPISDNKIL